MQPARPAGCFFYAASRLSIKNRDHNTIIFRDLSQSQDGNRRTPDWYAFVLIA